MSTDAIHDICERLRAVENWGARHDGRISVFWSQQQAWSRKTDNRLEDFERRLRRLEQRIVWLAGFAAGMGAITGSVLAKTL